MTVILLLFRFEASAASSADASSSVPHWRPNSNQESKNSNSNNDKTKTTTTLLKIIETETCDSDNQWKHETWTTSRIVEEADEDSGTTTPADADAETAPRMIRCSSPAQYQLKSNQEWVGDWKIAVTSSSSHGWVYSNTSLSNGLSSSSASPSPLLQYTTRQRTWLRTVQTTTTNSTTASATSKSLSKKAKKKPKRRRRRHPKWMQTIRDDFNFKGWGFSFYKSAVFKESFGAAVRLPLTINFDTWERHPALPSISLSVAAFYPGSATLSLNTSLRLEWIQWLFHQVYVAVPAVLWSVLLVLLRGLALAVSALLFPVTRKPLLLANTSGNREDDRNNNRSSPWKRLRQERPQYSRAVEERLGVSLSWRVSRGGVQGGEFRWSCWHYYAPAVSRLWERCLPSQWVVPSWMARRSAAIGWSLSGPVKGTEEGVLIAPSGLMSLSGYYFRRPQQQQQRSSSTTSSTTSSSTSTIPTTPTTTTTSEATAAVKSANPAGRISDNKDENEEEKTLQDESLRMIARSIEKPSATAPSSSTSAISKVASS